LLGVYEGTEAVRPWEGLAAPVSLADLERALTGARHLRGRFTPHPEIDHAYLLDQHLAVTFDPGVFDARPNSVHLLSYGSAILAALLDAVPAPGDESNVLRLATDDPVPLASFYALSAEGTPVRLESVSALLDALSASHGTPWTEESRAAASSDFEALHDQVWSTLEGNATTLREGIRARLAEQACQLLVDAAFADAARQAQTSGADEAVLVREETIYALSRYGEPFGSLLNLAGDRLRPPFHPQDAQMINRSAEQLRRALTELRRDGEELVRRLAVLEADDSPAM
jgi:hypothetical protein